MINSPGTPGCPLDPGRPFSPSKPGEPGKPKVTFVFQKLIQFAFYWFVDRCKTTTEKTNMFGFGNM